MEVSKVQLANGEVLVDLTEDSVTEETLAEGATAHDKSGARITGTMKSGGGSSVQSDWNQTDEAAADFIKNKPTRTVYGDTIEWDGNIDGRIVVEDYVCHISDVIIKVDDITDGAIVYAYSIGPVKIPFEAFVVEEDGFILGDAMVSVPYDNYEWDDVFFPKAGLYALVLGEPITIQFPGHGVFKSEEILPDILPNAIVLYSKEMDEERTRYLFTSGTEFTVATAVTRGKLMEWLFSGAKIVVGVIDLIGGMETICYATPTVIFTDGWSALVSHGVLAGSVVASHTAEYTP